MRQDWSAAPTRPGRGRPHIVGYDPGCERAGDRVEGVAAKVTDRRRRSAQTGAAARHLAEHQAAHPRCPKCGSEQVQHLGATLVPKTSGKLIDRRLNMGQAKLTAHLPAVDIERSFPVRPR